MHLLLLHLSDIHIADERDPVLTRASMIARAAASCASEPVRCVVLVTGDIAFSGKEEEYELARAFMTELVAELKQHPSSGATLRRCRGLDRRPGGPARQP